VKRPGDLEYGVDLSGLAVAIARSAPGRFSVSDSFRMLGRSMFLQLDQPTASRRPSGGGVGDDRHSEPCRTSTRRIALSARMASRIVGELTP